MKVFYNNKIYDDNELEQIECIEDDDGSIHERFVIKDLIDSPVFMPKNDFVFSRWQLDPWDRVDNILSKLIAYTIYLEKRIEKLENKGK